MAPPRSQPPPDETPQQPEQPEQQPSPLGPLGDAALAGTLAPGAGGLAFTAGAAAPAGAAVPLTGVAVAEAAAHIIAAFVKFARGRQDDWVPYMRDLVYRRYPEIVGERVSRMIADEAMRERAFLDKQRKRMRRLVPEALREPDPAERLRKVKSVLERERQYVRMREEAMAERALNAAEREIIKRKSPLGAYWKLSETVKEHTLDCILMGEKFWPWEVLDHVHPQLHHGCACFLLAFDEAVTLGYMTPEQIPDTKDAVRRAKKIMDDTGHLHESIDEQEIVGYLIALQETPFLHTTRERVLARYPKGFTKGGQFRPRRGGSPGAPVIAKRSLRMLRKLLPEHPLTPAQRAKRGDGRWVWIQGVRTFVPEHRQYERKIGDHTFASPPGGTNVYRDGKLVDTPGGGPTHPSVERGAAITKLEAPTPDETLAAVDELVANEKAREFTRAFETVSEALTNQSELYEPATRGASAASTHDALIAHAFEVTGEHSETRAERLYQVVIYAHPPTSSILRVNYDMTLGQQGVEEVQWRPGSGHPVSLDTPLLERPPRTWDEAKAEAAAVVGDLSRRYNSSPFFAGIQQTRDMGEYNGTHGWDGVIYLGKAIRPTIERIAEKRAKGEALTTKDKHDYYNAHETIFHEALHAAFPIGKEAYQWEPHRAMEESLTTELAHHLTVERLRARGEQDVLEWVASSPNHTTVQGTYDYYRNAFDTILNAAKIAPELRTSYLIELKVKPDPNARLDKLAADVAAAGVPSLVHHVEPKDAHDPEVARSFVNALLRNAEKNVGVEDWVPLTRPDLRDIPVQGVTFEGKRIYAGTKVSMARVDPTWVDADEHVSRRQVIANAGQIPMVDAQAEIIDLRPGSYTEFVATVQFEDGTVHNNIIPDEIKAILTDAPAPSPPKLVIDGQTIGPGDLIEYDNIADGTFSQARVTRVLRQYGFTHDSRKNHDAWVVEAISTEHSKDEGETVLLTRPRVGDHFKLVSVPEGHADEPPDLGDTQEVLDGRREVRTVPDPRLAMATDVAPEAGKTQRSVENFAGIFEGFKYTLRDTYTNKDVPVTVKVHIADVPLGSDRFAVEGAIETGNGSQVGSFARQTIGTEVLHEHMEIARRFQGQGFAAAFNAHAEAEYRKQGYEHVKISAVDVGSFAWARAGWEFDPDIYAVFAYSSGGDPEHAGYEAARRILEKYGEDTLVQHSRERGVPKEMIAEFISRFPTQKDIHMGRVEGKFHSEFEIAGFGREHTWVEQTGSKYAGQKMWLGKLVMLGVGWEGRKQLRPQGMMKVAAVVDDFDGTHYEHSPLYGGMWHPLGSEFMFESDKPSNTFLGGRDAFWKAMYDRSTGKTWLWTTDERGIPHHSQVMDRLHKRGLGSGQWKDYDIATGFGQEIDSADKLAISPEGQAQIEAALARHGSTLRYAGEMASGMGAGKGDPLHAPSEFLTLPKSGKLAEASRETLAVVDSLLSVPEMYGPIPIRATAGKNARGGYLRAAPEGHPTYPKWEGPTVRMTGFGQGQSNRPAKLAEELTPGDVLVKSVGHSYMVKEVERIEKEIGWGRDPVERIIVTTYEGPQALDTSFGDTSKGTNRFEYKPDELVGIHWKPPADQIPPAAAMFPSEIRASVKDDPLEAFDTQATIVHELAHYIDNQAFMQYHLHRGFASQHAGWQSYPASEREEHIANPEFANVIVRPLFEQFQTPSPLSEWYDVVRESPEIKALHSGSLMELGTHKYLIAPDEMFARSFTQWVATRSHDPHLNEWLDAQQNYPRKTIKHTEKNYKGESRVYEVDTPNYLLLRQWSDENFIPIGQALDRAFERLGWLNDGGRDGDRRTLALPGWEVGGRPGGGSPAELAVAADQARADGRGQDAEEGLGAGKGDLAYYEVHGLPTTTRVFAAYSHEGSVPAGVLTVDKDRGTVELVRVQEDQRRQGIATNLLAVAREATGLPLTTDTGERSPMGAAWAGSVGLSSVPDEDYAPRDLTDREANAMGARLTQLLFGSPDRTPLPDPGVSSHRELHYEGMGAGKTDQPRYIVRKNFRGGWAVYDLEQGGTQGDPLVSFGPDTQGQDEAWAEADRLNAPLEGMSAGKTDTVTPEVLAAYEARRKFLDMQARWRSEELDSPERAAAEKEVSRLEQALVPLEREAGGRVYRLRDDQLIEGQKRMARLAKGAAKLNTPEPKLRVMGEAFFEIKTGDHKGDFDKRTYVVVEGEEPKIAGWEFMATLQHLDGSNVIRRVPGKEEDVDLDAYRSGEAICDYCKTKRDRKHTFILRKEDTGELQQIGRNCLRDFIGHGDPEKLAAFLEHWMRLDADFGDMDDDDDVERGGSRKTYTPIDDYLVHVATMIRTEGWAAKSSSDRPTAYAALENRWNFQRQKFEQGQQMWVDPTEQDVKRADEALAWVREVVAAKDELSEFDHNMVAMASGEYVPERGEGIIAYIPVAHARHLEREIEFKKRAEQDADSDHVGEIGKRIEVEAEVTNVIEHPGNYGTTFITKLRDDAGNVYTWFGSYELERGERYKGMWAVKKHDEYQGTKQTVLNRPTKLEMVGGETEAETVSYMRLARENPDADWAEGMLVRRTDKDGLWRVTKLVSGAAVTVEPADEVPVGMSAGKGEAKVEEVQPERWLMRALERADEEATNDPEHVWLDILHDMERSVEQGDKYEYRFLAAADGDGLIGAMVLAEKDQPGVEVPEGYIIMGRIASNHPGTGTALLKRAAQIAAEQDKGLIGWAIPTSRGFFRKQGMASSRASVSTHVVWFTPEQVREYAA